MISIAVKFKDTLVESRLVQNMTIIYKYYKIIRFNLNIKFIYDSIKSNKLKSKV